MVKPHGETLSSTTSPSYPHSSVLVGAAWDVFGNTEFPLFTMGGAGPALSEPGL